jgi:hypothetical protein
MEEIRSRAAADDKRAVSLIVRNLRILLLLACALAGVFVAIVVIGRLQSDATAARDAELTLSAIRVDLLQMRDVPWGALPDEGGDPEEVRGELQGCKSRSRRRSHV